MNDVMDIIERLEEILNNPNNESADQVGSYIVGATLARDDIEQIFIKCPDLEEIAELGADLETMTRPLDMENTLIAIKQKLDLVKGVLLDTPHG